jgi:hypothetical protein
MTLEPLWSTAQLSAFEDCRKSLTARALDGRDDIIGSRKFEGIHALS